MDAMIDAYVYEGLIEILDIAPLNLMISEYSFRLELSSISGSVCLTKILRAEGIIASLLLKRLLHKAWLQ